MQLTAAGLRCTRGGREVLSGLDFSLSSGELLAITGRNGSGKSTLLRVVSGLVRISAGTVTLAGGNPDRSIGEQAHYLGHLDALKSSLSVGENLKFWIDYLGGTGEVRAALAAVALDTLEGLPAAYLSAGQRRRLSLARLVAIARPIWLLDEPTTALDMAAQDILLHLMRSHLSGGGLILAATHAPLGLDGASELHLGADGAKTREAAA